MSAIKVGDTVTFAHIYETVSNPDRRWWQVWKPRFVATDNPQTFIVKEIYRGR